MMSSFSLKCRNEVLQDGYQPLFPVSALTKTRWGQGQPTGLFLDWTQAPKKFGKKKHFVALLMRKQLPAL